MVQGVAKTLFDKSTPTKGLDFALLSFAESAKHCPDFIFGPENSLVDSLVRSVESHARNLNNRQTFNPIYLFGGPGTGKSHLTQGLSNAWSTLQKRADALHLTPNEFARYCGSRRLQLKKTNNTSLASASLLVIDDIHYLRRRHNVQVKLAEYIDQCINSDCLIIVTGASSPVNNELLLPRLASRLCSGLFFELHQPGPGVRAELIRRFAESSDVDLTDTCINTAAQMFTGTVSEIQEALSRQFRYLPRGRKINEDEFKRNVSEFAEVQTSQLPHCTIATVSRYYQIPMSQLTGKSRRHSTVQARGVVIYLLRTIANFSFTKIGGRLGGRDHSTILYSYRKTKSRLERDPELRHAVAKLQSVILAENGKNES